MRSLGSSRAFAAWSREIQATSTPLGNGVMEMRIDYGPGYRVYYLHRGSTIVILLCGGDKRTQPQDIKRAHKMAERL
jgi:putative addiction module killer protein